MTSKELSKIIRIESLKMHYKSQTSHIGSNFSVADILSVLYNDILKYDIKNPNYINRDRVIYSKGHAATILYALLAEKGFIEKELINNYGNDNQILASHITHKVDGIEFSTGSLGHGANIGCGIAIALKRKNIDAKVFVILSDGEMNEGSTWEAILFASHHRLDNLIFILDNNKLQAFGNTKDIINMGNISNKLIEFGWETIEVDGHNHDELKSIFNKLPLENNKPSFILAHTIKGKGVDFMENNLLWHYRSPNEEEYLLALKKLGENNL
ncbi:transketolase [Brachyspira sp.]|uniref:transketolase n=1 Tax=Brachyspira sp. TaxID=1977261 RepID=UPI002606CF44|nr:transketolase [Brachyspira sp.]